MDLFNLPKNTEVAPEKGKILIAEPFLGDSSFTRSVVLLCSHGPDGTIGFILNKPTSFTLEKLLPGVSAPDMPVSYGGPVQTDMLHMLHNAPEVFGGTQIEKELYWGGNFTLLPDLNKDKELSTATNLRFFTGYAGWSPGQLEKELEEGAWLVGHTTSEILFHTPADKCWQQALLSLGRPFSQLVNWPLHPQLN